MFTSQASNEIDATATNLCMQAIKNCFNEILHWATCTMSISDFIVKLFILQWNAVFLDLVNHPAATEIQNCQELTWGFGIQK